MGVIGGAILTLLLLHALGAIVIPGLKPTERKYANHEEWEIIRDSNGALKGLVVKRDARET